MHEEVLGMLNQFTFMHIDSNMHQGATVEALSIYRRWRGYSLDYEGSQDQMVFCLKEPNSCLARTRAIRISTKATKNKDWDFEIKGNFPDKDCCIVDSEGKTMAQVSNSHSR